MFFHYPTIKLWKNESVKLMSILGDIYGKFAHRFCDKIFVGQVFGAWHLRTIPTGNRSKKKNSVFSGSDFFMSACFHYPTIKLWKNELVKLMSILGDIRQIRA